VSDRIFFNCAATMIGSVPCTDPGKAWKKIDKYLKDLPSWPQLPMRSNLENMYIQYSEGFPGLTIDGQKISFAADSGFEQALEKLFDDEFEHRTQGYSIGAEYAAGLQYPAQHGSTPLPLIKGQLTGPISWGLCVSDSNGRGIIYDETLAEAICKFIKLKAAWQESYLGTIARRTVLFVDEPYLSSLGSAFVALPNDRVSLLLEEVLSGIEGMKGIHCCGGTDWSLLLGLPIDILSFDAYNYLDSVLCYEKELKSFLGRGGTIAWGIVPNDEDTLKKESVSSLLDRFDGALAALSRAGIPTGTVAAQSLLTPSCGLASLSEDAAEHVLELLSKLSDTARQKYVR
jgi:methionine synthase II (cobalamin-independent)